MAHKSAPQNFFFVEIIAIIFILQKNDYHLTLVDRILTSESKRLDDNLK